jgi:tetratricopeptide (TPR) repeat protein
VASVSGLTFSTAEVAAGCRQAPETIAVRCEQLAQRGQFITEEGFAEWPDGTFTMNYHFRHALYQEGVYARLGSGQKVRLHRLIGERREVGYGDQVGEIAGELALHFEQGRDYGRAVRYQQQAGENALRRNAYQEALSHLSQGLELLQTLPETSERKQQELALRLLLSTVLTATQGYASDELEQNLQRALVLCEEFNETIKLAPVLVGLGRAYLMRADKKNLDRIVELEEHAVEHHSDPAVAVQIYTQLGTIEYYRGKHASSAHYYAQALTLYDTQKHEDLLFSFGGDLTVILPVNSSWNSWLIGYPDQAWPRVVQGIARAEAISHSFSLVHALIYGTVVRLFRREPHDAQPLVERAMTLAREYGFSLYLKVGSVLQGCIAVQQGKSEEGVAKLTPALAEYRATGMQLLLPFFLS